jgi:hypothetical protein
MTDLRISLATGSAAEARTHEQLLHVLASHDLRKWTFTAEIRIEEGK